MTDVRNLIFRYLDTNGDGTGVKNATGNYSSGATDFYFTPKKPCVLTRMILTVTDTTGMQQQEYGNLGAALTNGIVVQVQDSSNVVLKDLTDNVPVKTNGGWARLCYDAQLLSWGAGDETLSVRWTFERAGKPISLSQGKKLVVTFNDDLTGLLTHYFMVQGHYL